MAPLTKNSVLISDETHATWVRRAVLFLAMLMSGGLLFLPREPMLALTLLLSLLLLNPVTILRAELTRIWFFLVIVLVISLIGAAAFPIEDTAIRFANFAAGLILLSIYLDLPKSQIMRDSFPILVFFSVQALLTPLFALAVPEFFIRVSNLNSVYYTFLGIFTYHEIGLGGGGLLGLQRPDGFFFEPGVLQIYLNLFLYIALFYRKSLGFAGLALAGIFATQSTTGVVIALMQCGFAALQWIRISQASVSILAVILSPIALGPIAYLTYVNIVEKLFGSMQGSASARSFDTETGFLIVQNNPIFGIGFSKERFSDEFRTFGRTVNTMLGDGALERTMSNGLVQVMVMLGIPVFLFFVYAVWKQRLFNHSVLVALILLLSLTTEALFLTPFFLAIAFSGLLVQPKGGVPVARRSPARFRPQGMA